MHSVLNRSAKNLIHEIILVDDYSTLKELKGKLQNYVASLDKVKLVRTQQREGLIRGRMLGAKHATGEILVFLDSHCEVNKEWLPPLLERISKNRTTVVCPVIDMISADTFEYQSSPLVRGGFNWGLHFSWEPVPNYDLDKNNDLSQPIRYVKELSSTKYFGGDAGEGFLGQFLLNTVCVASLLVSLPIYSLFYGQLKTPS